MKTFIRKIVPANLLKNYRHFKRLNERWHNRNKTVEDVFTEIYLKNKWGGANGEFCSGGGTSDQRVVSAYISVISEVATREGFQGLAFVDLGCGDFWVGRHLLSLCSSYTGVDIVKPLIEHNQMEYGDATTRFIHMDIIQDELPDGDVCFIRQVLQHLSNQQIASVLEKLQMYQWVFITEHYPIDNETINPNVEKPVGGDVRVYDNSGVYLTKDPFNLPMSEVEEVLAVSFFGREGANLGVIRTYLYKPT